MRTAKITAKATVNDYEAGKITVVAEKHWPAIDVMKIGQCRAWVTRNWNKLFPGLEKGMILRVHFSGNMPEHPYTPYGGGIRGCKGMEPIREGDME